MAPTEHRRAGDPNAASQTHERQRVDASGEHPHDRKTDSDYIARIGAFIIRWKLFWAIGVGITAWYGKNILEPIRVSAQNTAELTAINTKIDSVIVPRLQKAEDDRAMMIRTQEQQGEILGYLSRMQCLALDPVERVKGRLDCRDIPIQPNRNPP